VERGIPRSANHLGVDFCDDIARDSSTSSHSLPLVAGFQFLGSSFIFLFGKDYTTIAEVFWSGFLAKSFAGNRRVAGSASCFFVEVRVSSTENSSLFSSVIALSLMPPFT
jgi:hypothetical protein